jgi:hypothetical protein
MGVESSVAKTEQVLIMLRMINSLSCKKMVGFPMSL